MSTMPITISGNLTQDPSTKVSDSGTIWTSFRIGSTNRYQNKQGDWVDGETLYLDCRAFGSLADNINICLRRGLPVIVHGRLVTETWKDKNGDDRQSVYLKATMVALDLARSVVATQKIAYDGTLKGEAILPDYSLSLRQKAFEAGRHKTSEIQNASAEQLRHNMTEASDPWGSDPSRSDTVSDRAAASGVSQGGSMQAGPAREAEPARAAEPAREPATAAATNTASAGGEAAGDPPF